MKKLYKRPWLLAAGALVGAAGGFLFWKYVGCTSGTCTITSSPVKSTIYFSLVGTWLFSMFQMKQNNGQ